MKFEKELVNKYFRDGIPFLMFGFDPWTLEKQINGMNDSGLWTLIINDEFRNDLNIYVKNWNTVLGKYFTWDEATYPDPVDQCHALASKAVEIHTLLFKGLNVEEKRLDPTFFNLWYATAKYLDNLCEEIMGWALTHKFINEIMDDAFEN